MRSTIKHIYGLSIVAIFGMLLTASSLSFASDGYENITVGMPVEQVEKLIGTASDMEKDFSKDTLNYIAKTLKNLDNKDSEVFVLWKRVNEKLIYVIGFNDAEKVAVKHKFLFMDKP